MGHITHLPIEIISSIWRLISSDDITSLFMTCKFMTATGESFMEKHKERRKKYSIIEKMENNEDRLDHLLFDTPSFECLRPPIILSTLKDISDEPAIAEYVREVRIRDYNTEWKVSDDKRIFWKNASGGLLAKTLLACPYLDRNDGAAGMAEEITRCITSIDEGNEDVIIALLLSLLPKVHTLRFDCRHLVPETCLHVVRRIASTPTATALSRLRNVKIDFYNSIPSEQPLAMLASFAALPSLVSISAKNIGPAEYLPSEDSSTTMTSKVSKLTLKRISIDTDDLSSFLAMFEPLQEFKFESLVPRFIHVYFYPRDITNSLFCHSGKTLTHLTLHSRCNAPEKSAQWMGSLRKFKVLTHIRTDWCLLLDEREPLEHQLMDNLPYTVQELTLKVDPDFNVETASVSIGSLAAFKVVRFPVLRHLLLVHISPDKAVALLKKPFVRKAEGKGLRIRCDTRPDPDRAGIERREGRGVEFATLTEEVERLLQGTG